MKMNRIEIFLPCFTEKIETLSIEPLVSNEAIARVWIMSRAGGFSAETEKIGIVEIESLDATATFKQMAASASAEYVLYCSKGLPEISVNDIVRLCDAMPQDASMAYSDYYKIINGEKREAPAIDYQKGSLRNDFDFGSVLLFRVSALKKYLDESPEEYAYAGLYQLRLSMSRLGSVFHFKEFLYSEPEVDNRKSGEKQFDYVNPSQRSVQIEMEAVCTHHLKTVGACLPACKYEYIDPAAGDFPVEASVIIPVLNRASTIADAIASVLAQETKFPFNIIVVDNHSTDGTGEIIDGFADERVVHLVPSRTDLGIGGCWNEAVNSPLCGRFAVQLDSDDLYSSPATLQQIVDAFYKQKCAMLIGTYRICDFELNTLPPGIIDHREWSEENGRNNALRINGLGAPRAFFTPVIRAIGFPNVSYGEDYAVGLQISRNYRIGRIYDVLYLCRRWGGNSDAALSHEKVNAHNYYKDSLRTAEFEARQELLSQMSLPSSDELELFFDKQLQRWHDAAERYRQLENVKVRSLDNGITLQFNPARMVSTGANVDAASVARRACFLCADNRPAEQVALSALGSLEVLVNPFPILPFHLTLPLKKHSPQRLCDVFADMLHLSEAWRQMAIFYNGAKCGASAPDHAHLQAVRRCDVPLLGNRWNEIFSSGLSPLLFLNGSAIFNATGYVVPLFVIVAKCVSDSVELMSRLMDALPLPEGDPEPMMNVLSCYSETDGYVTVVVPRATHRPACYFATDKTQRLVSPGTLDMMGLVITPRECDFESINDAEAAAILREVALSDEAVACVGEKLSGVL